MTMHLMSPAFTTTKHSRKSEKMTTGKYSKFAQDWVDYNKQMKRLGSKTKTFDEYVSYRLGKTRPAKKTKAAPLPKYERSNHRELYPSQSEIGVAFAKKPNAYTGDNLIGIATMHKSNMVPIFKKEDAEDISRMRRG